MGTTVLLVVLVAAVSGLGCGWIDWHTEVHDSQIPLWRRTIASVGLLAVTIQAFLFLASWLILGHQAVSVWRLPHGLLRHMQYAPIALVLLVLLAVPCVLMGKSHSRRWLLVSSVALAISWLYVVRM